MYARKKCLSGGTVFQLDYFFVFELNKKKHQMQTFSIYSEQRLHLDLNELNSGTPKKAVVFEIISF